jgi:succinate dehydrogenase flavin-adding protein (antitoxin of CptAB toxin-antitoxin module)
VSPAQTTLIVAVRRATLRAVANRQTGAENRGVTMGFVKYIDFSTLSDDDREALQQLLEAQKNDLVNALRNANEGLAVLKRHAKKSAKKSKSKKAKK